MNRALSGLLSYQIDQPKAQPWAFNLCPFGAPNWPYASVLVYWLAFGVSASAASSDFNIDAIVSSVSSPMFEIRNVFPFSLP